MADNWKGFVTLVEKCCRSLGYDISHSIVILSGEIKSVIAALCIGVSLNSNSLQKLQIKSLGSRRQQIKSKP